MPTPRKTTRRAAAIPAVVREPRQQAADHRHTREAHRKELIEDYVEVIAELIETHNEARTVDIAARLGVSHVTVIKALARLQREALVVTRPYRSIMLTDTGLALAKRVRHRHWVVMQFLLSIGVRPETARTDAEGIEHHVSAETMAAFERLVRARRTGGETE
ncbi:MAG: manganese-binding transcriptional regulator MntR [Phycisphaerae bacterium]